MRSIDLPQQVIAEIPASAKPVSNAEDKHLFMLQVNQEQRLLTFGVTQVKGHSCVEELEHERRRTLTAMQEPAASALSRLDFIDLQTLDGMDVLYSEIAYRTPQEAEADGPYHPMAMYVICANETTLVSVNLGRREGKLDDASLQLLTDIATSVEVLE